MSVSQSGTAPPQEEPSLSGGHGGMWLPVSNASGGTLPGIRLDKSSDLEEQISDFCFAPN